LKKPRILVCDDEPVARRGAARALGAESYDILECVDGRECLAALERRVAERGSAVVVVAEGAGQDLMSDEQTGTDASGNRKLGDIGRFLEAEIVGHYTSTGRELTLKFLKPSYAIRSVPAKAYDSVYCVRLAQAAAHAGMAGRTDMVVGRRHNRFVHVPIDIVVSERNEVAPDGDLWLSVLESTAQPLEMR